MGLPAPSWFIFSDGSGQSNLDFPTSNGLDFLLFSCLFYGFPPLLNLYICISVFCSGGAQIPDNAFHANFLNRALPPSLHDDHLLILQTPTFISYCLLPPSFGLGFLNLRKL